jgi:hypothetical protein
MIKPIPISAIFFALVCLISCTPNLDRTEYIKWVQDYENGLHTRKTFSEFIFDVQYQPGPYLALLKQQTPIADGETLEYYTLRISLSDPTTDIIGYNAHSHTEKQERLYYFSYLFQHDLYLEVEGRRIPCVLFHSESTDLKKVRTFVLGFEGGGNITSDDVTFIINSPKFNALPIRIKIRQQDIPTVKI